MNDILPFVIEHWALCALFIALLAATVLYEKTARAKQNQHTLSPYDVVHQMNKADALILDLRPKDQFVRGHIINAVNIPPAQWKEQMKRLEAYKGRPVVLVCAQNSPIEPLRRQVLATTWFEKIAVLAGGMPAWQEAQLPIEKN